MSPNLLLIRCSLILDFDASKRNVAVRSASAFENTLHRQVP